MVKRKNRMGIAAFDASDYLDNEEVIAEYLSAALEDPNPDVFLRAVGDVAKGRALVHFNYLLGTQRTENRGFGHSGTYCVDANVVLDVFQRRGASQHQQAAL